VVFIFISSALLLLITAGSLGWLYAWVYAAVCILILQFSALILPLELIAERGSKKENTEPWDAILTGLLIISSMVMLIVAGLDFRWNWSPKLAIGLHIVSIFIFILGCALMIWAMNANRFFSTAVRIQFDRGQIVCSSGPYRYIRHPGYLGMIVYNLASPIFLGSLWAMIPAAIIVSLYVIRTWLEDKTLLKKLPGYEQYADCVKYRLLPWLW
jgi:protein-S-isoprenylcysteine O-methyltransferase Ste14